MKIAVNTFTRRVALFLLAIIFAVMSVSVGLCARAESDDYDRELYYFTDYHGNPDYDYVGIAAEQAGEYCADNIHVNRIEAPSMSPAEAVEVFYKYVNNNTIKNNSYAIIEIRGKIGPIDSDSDDIHPVSYGLNYLTDELKEHNCKILLIMNTCEDMLDNGNDDALRFLYNVDMHLNLDLYYVFGCSVLCNMIEANNTSIRDCTVILNSFFSEYGFFRDYFIPFVLQTTQEVNHDVNEYYSDTAYFLDSDFYYAFMNEDFFEPCREALYKDNITIWFEQSLGNYIVWKAIELGGNYYIEESTIVISEYNIEDAVAELKCNTYAVCARYCDNYEYWAAEELMCALRDYKTDGEVFRIFSYTDKAVDEYGYREYVYYCGISEEGIFDFLLPRIVAFLTDSDLSAYDRFIGRCDITDMPIEFGEGGWLVMPDGSIQIAKILRIKR